MDIITYTCRVGLYI